MPAHQVKRIAAQRSRRKFGQVGAGRVKAHFAGIVHGEVQRFLLPGLGAMNFVMHGALGGGVTRSLALDAHGKSLSSAILDIELG
ncbi:hypothetical protein ACI48D_02520 [Massilia sp. LXY-6]|uniref:AtuA-related protein n=1 Tax=Massilia sp. LXY-6 TaxID=3379823 RepID=UPI003EE3F8C2